MGLPDNTEADVLEHLLGWAQMPFGTSYLGLFTTTPAEDGTGGVEVAGNNYARVLLDEADFDGVHQDAEEEEATRALTTNTAQIIFPRALGGDWGALTAMGVWDASSGGTLRWFQPLTSLVLVVENRQFLFEVGSLTFAAD